MTNAIASNDTAYAVFHFRFFLGFVAAPSLKVAKQRAAAIYPGKRLEVEMSARNKNRARDRRVANVTYQAKHTV